MPRHPRVRVVVLNFNGGDTTLRCLEHLQRLDWPSQALEVVCVDNASVDGSPERIAERFPDVELRRNPANTGFPANNLAMGDLDDVDYVALLNNDAFAEPGWLAALVEAMEADDRLGAVSAKLVLEPRFAEVAIESETFDPGPLDRRALGVMVRGADVEGKDVWSDAHLGEGGWGPEAEPGGGRFEWTQGTATLRLPADPGAAHATVWLQAERAKPVRLTTSAGTVEVAVGPEPTAVAVPLGPERVDVLNNVGSVVFTDGSGADRGWLERDDGQYDEPADVFAWCGGSVLLRPAYLADVGLFDERFFLYYEDTDLSWRGRARGWSFRTAPAAVARHLHAASSVEGSDLFAFHVERNRLLMLVKNAPWRMAVGQVLAFGRATTSYAARDVVGPVLHAHRPRPLTVRRRLKALVGFAQLLPAMVADRRVLRRARRVPDPELAGWLVRR